MKPEMLIENANRRPVMLIAVKEILKFRIRIRKGYMLPQEKAVKSGLGKPGNTS